MRSKAWAHLTLSIKCYSYVTDRLVDEKTIRRSLPLLEFSTLLIILYLPNPENARMHIPHPNSPTRFSFGLLLSALLVPALVQGQLFDAFVNRVGAAPDSLRSAIVDSFLVAHPSSPFFEGDSTAIVFFRGAASSVTFPGDANGWSTTAAPLIRLSTTDFWYRRDHFEADARLDYKFVLNGSTWILDPRNAFTQLGGFGPNSELRMPRYPDPVEARYDPTLPHGAIFDTTLSSAAMGNSRPVRVYLPAGYEQSQDSFRVVLFHDGPEYISLAAANNILDYLIANNRMRPVIGVFVPPIASIRHNEYAASRMPAFAAFIANDVMGWVDARFRTRKAPWLRAVVGASDGGNISLYLGLRYSSIFGNVCAQSSNVVDSVMNGFSSAPRLNLRFWLDLGTYDLPVLIPLVRNFVPVLTQKGYDLHYEEVHEGHSWGNWKGHVGRALQFFFPSPDLAVSETPGSPGRFALEQNYPNPFNPSTTIRFSLPVRAHVTLKVFNVLGQLVKQLVDADLEGGLHEVHLDARALASGVYLYRLQAASSAQSRAMLLLR